MDDKKKKRENIDLVLIGHAHGGLIRKKGFPTFIHETAKDYENVFVSAGKVGYQIELAPEVLRSVVHGYSYTDLIK